MLSKLFYYNSERGKIRWDVINITMMGTMVASNLWSNHCCRQRNHREYLFILLWESKIISNLYVMTVEQKLYVSFDSQGIRGSGEVLNFITHKNILNWIKIIKISSLLIKIIFSVEVFCTSMLLERALHKLCTYIWAARLLNKDFKCVYINNLFFELSTYYLCSFIFREMTFT